MVIFKKYFWNHLNFSGDLVLSNAWKKNWIHKSTYPLFFKCSIGINSSLSDFKNYLKWYVASVYSVHFTCLIWFLMSRSEHPPPRRLCCSLFVTDSVTRWRCMTPTENVNRPEWSTSLFVIWLFTHSGWTVVCGTRV